MVASSIEAIERECKHDGKNDPHVFNSGERTQGSPLSGHRFTTIMREDTDAKAKVVRGNGWLANNDPRVIDSGVKNIGTSGLSGHRSTTTMRGDTETAELKSQGTTWKWMVGMRVPMESQVSGGEACRQCRISFAKNE